MKKFYLGIDASKGYSDFIILNHKKQPMIEKGVHPKRSKQSGQFHFITISYVLWEVKIEKMGELFTRQKNLLVIRITCHNTVILLTKQGGSGR